MATVPGQLIWEIVKRNNCFLVKQFGRGNAKVQFSKESNNLVNINSYKHSGNTQLLLTLDLSQVCSFVESVDMNTSHYLYMSS